LSRRHSAQVERTGRRSGKKVNHPTPRKEEQAPPTHKPSYSQGKRRDRPTKVKIWVVGSTKNGSKPSGGEKKKRKRPGAGPLGKLRKARRGRKGEGEREFKNRRGQGCSFEPTRTTWRAEKRPQRDTNTTNRRASGGREGCNSHGPQGRDLGESIPSHNLKKGKEEEKKRLPSV